MRLRTLTLKNYRKFRSAVIDFPDGVVGIVGRNGSGKSTIVEAIGWALYGHDASRTEKGLVKRMGAAAREPCRVELEFDLDNHYRVVREMVGPSLTARASVEVNGTLVVQPGANSSKAATEYISKALGMGQEAFFTSVIARQRELNALSDKTAGERRRIVLRMLEIDAIDEAIRRVRVDRRVGEGKVEGMRMSLKDPGALNRDRERYLDEEGRAREESRVCKDAAERFGEVVRGLEQRLEGERRAHQRYMELGSAIARVKDRRGAEEERLSRISEELAHLLEREQLLKGLGEKEGGYQRLLSRKDHLEGERERFHRRERLLTQMGDLNKRTAQIASEVEGDRSLLSALPEINERVLRLREGGEEARATARQASLEARESGGRITQREERRCELAEERGKIEQLGPESNCPTCLRPLGDHYTVLLKKYGEDITAIQSEIAEQKKAMKEKEDDADRWSEKETKLAQRIQEGEEQMRELIRVEGDLGSRVQMAREIDEQGKAIEEQLASIGAVDFRTEEYDHVVERVRELTPTHERVISLKSEVARIPSIQEEQTRVKESASALTRELTEREQELSALSFDAGAYDALVAELEDRRGKLNEAEKRLVALEGELRQAVEEGKRIEKEITEQKELRDKIDQERESMAYLERLAGTRDTGLFNEFKRHLIGRIGPLVSRYCSELFSSLTDHKYETMEIDENYDIHVYDGGESFALTRYSGGEQDLANLCLRLAISQVIAERSGSEINLLVLDEIFGSQDQERRGNLMVALGELSKRFRQILLITHVEDVKDQMSSVLRVEEREDGTSQVILE